MQVLEAILFVMFLVALGFVAIGPLVVVRALAYRRVVRAEVARRGGSLVHVFPSWIFRMVVDGWRVGRRVRFEWVDGEDRMRVSECEFMHFLMESLVGRGRFRWLGDVSQEPHRSAELTDEREPE
jgi:hypothetical protein